MDENKLRFGVGVLVISAVGVGIILVFLFGAFPSVLQRDYQVQVYFPSAEGISANSPVIRDGVKIGRVSDISLLDKGGVLITLALDADKPLSHRYIPRISSGNFVTGDADLQFVKASARQLDQLFGKKPDIINEPYTDDEFLRYGDREASLLAMQGEISQTLRSIREAGDSVAQAGTSINLLTQDANNVIDGTNERIDVLGNKAAETLAEVQLLVQDLRKIVGDEKLRENIKRSGEQFPALLERATATLDETSKTFKLFGEVGDRFNRVGKQAEDIAGTVKDAANDARQIVKDAGGAVKGAERTLTNLAEITEPFAENSDQLVARLFMTLDSVNRSLAEVEQFGRALNNSDGTVRRLLEDDEIYFQIRRTVENIELATARIRPILDDVRIFSDKIARDPRQLGVRGALTKQPNGMGIK